MPAGSRDQLLHELTQRIREIEATVRPDHAAPVSLGIPAVEDWLPERRLLPGSLVELLSSAGGAGAWTLALFFARNACGPGQVLVVVDGQACFYPPAAVSLGIEMEQLDRYSSQDAGGRRTRGRSIAPSLGRRIRHRLVRPADHSRLSAASTGGRERWRPGPSVAFDAARHTPSFAALRLLVTPVAENRDAPARVFGGAPMSWRRLGTILDFGVRRCDG